MKLRDLLKMILPTRAKIGLLDIETAPIKANTWGLFDQTVGLNQIDREWTILSYCFMPLGGKRKDVVYKDNRDAAEPWDDKALLLDLWRILDEYDYIIAQNGKRFDSRKIRARLIMEGYTPPAPFKVIDTMLMARSVAAFTSNKQEWLSEYLSFVEAKKDAHKEFPGFALWRECLAGNPRAWAAMRKYNIQDVWGMREIYLRLRPWVAQHPNLAIHEDTTEHMCPRCTSTDVKFDGYVYTNISKFERYHCGHCGGYSRGRKSANTKDVRAVALQTQ